MAWRKGNSHLGCVIRTAAAAVLTASALILGAAPADAHGHRHFRHYASHAHVRRLAHAHGFVAGVPASPAFSALVVDANSGRTLYAADENGLRHPASITKVMTLYLLFEQLDRGAMTLQTRIPISEHAAAQEPSKLGLDPGDTIGVEDAIKAVVTRSANDIAVAIAEAIGRDESTFADMMTRKAHALGMSNTTYRNASGLPNDQQITTARDLTILARSLEERFPRYFRYFSTEEFEYDGETIGNHNHLLGRVDGVDGIKTGYTRASGFNLLTSVHRDGRSLIAVVMGGHTAAARDRVMENLIDDHLAQCSTVRTATRVADASEDETSPVQPSRPASVLSRFRPACRRILPPPGDATTARATTPATGDDEPTTTRPTLRVAAVRAVASTHPADAAPPPMPPIAKRPPRSWSRTSSRRRRLRQPISGGRRTRRRRGACACRRDASGQAEGRSERAWGGQDAVPTSGRRTFRGRFRGRRLRVGKGWKIQIGATADPAKATALLDKARQRDRTALARRSPSPRR